MCGVASQPREWAHSQFCLRTQPWIKNGINTSSESNFCQPSRNSLVTNNSLSSMREHLAIRQKWELNWLGEHNLDILGPGPGISPALNPIENFWSILKTLVDTQKHTNSDKHQALIMQEWAAFSQDVAQKLIDSMPGRIAEVLKKKGQHCKYWLFATSCNCQ